MKSFPWILSLLLLAGGCDKQSSSRTETNSNAESKPAQWANQKFVPPPVGSLVDEGQSTEQSRTNQSSLTEIKATAEKGDAAAQYNIAVRYMTGEGVVKNLEEGVKWFRKAAEQGSTKAQYVLGLCYFRGDGVVKDYTEAVEWWHKAAEHGDAAAQSKLGLCYAHGTGVPQDYPEAFKWFSKAASQGDASAQNSLGVCYLKANGVAKNETEAAKWFRRAAEQGVANAQEALGASYFIGRGVPKDYIEAYKWLTLASAQDSERSKRILAGMESEMTPEQIAEGQRLAREFKPRKPPQSDSFVTSDEIANSSPTISGTGFLITGDGFLISNAHVVEGAAQIRLVTSAGLISAKVVKADSANDLALLKAEGQFATLPVAASRAVKLGSTVATVGFPNIGLQGFAPKLAKGEIASLSGPADDARYFQISVPLQPGNSGGALVDERGNVVGVVSAKLNAATALAASGALPENVNYAVKSSYLLSFLESVPEVSAKLKEPNTKDMKFADVVEQAKEAAVLVLVY